jgi:hypothetical protein
LFAAPEQLDNADNANERSDIYSLGRVLCFLLLERSPGFQVEDDPKLDNLAGFPTALVAIVRRATQVKPARRFATVDEMRVALEQCLTGWAATKAKVNNAVRWFRVNFAVLSVLLLVATSAIVIAVLQTRRADEQAKLAAEQTKLAAEQARLAASESSARARIEALQAEIDNLLTQLSAAKDEATRLGLQKQLEELQQRERQMRAARAPKKSGGGLPDDPDALVRPAPTQNPGF